MTREYYKHPYKGDVKEINNGFNWAAFIFSFIWSAAKGIWWLAIIDLVIRIFLLVAIWPFLPIYWIVMAFVYGFKGNVAYKENLIGKGYRKMTKEII
jgi:hypothetical protein